VPAACHARRSTSGLHEWSYSALGRWPPIALESKEATRLRTREPAGIAVATGASSAPPLSSDSMTLLLSCKHTHDQPALAALVLSSFACVCPCCWFERLMAARVGVLQSLSCGISPVYGAQQACPVLLYHMVTFTGMLRLRDERAPHVDATLACQQNLRRPDTTEPSCCSKEHIPHMQQGSLTAGLCGAACSLLAPAAGSRCRTRRERTVDACAAPWSPCGPPR
jgi:hypothetical protein